MAKIYDKIYDGVEGYLSHSKMEIINFLYFGGTQNGKCKGCN